jgi:Galactose oxidase, central domain
VSQRDFLRNPGLLHVRYLLGAEGPFKNFDYFWRAKLKTCAFVLMMTALLGSFACSSGNNSATTKTTYTIGGMVSGLSGSGLVLQDNGGNNLTISTNGSFSFTASVSPGATYKVTVLTQPSTPAQTCAIASGSGTATANVTNIQVTCSTNSTANEWTWVGGPNSCCTLGLYGILGTPASTNQPGPRLGSVYWSDASGNFWMFGGFDISSQVDFNDVWEYSKGLWTWIGGSDQPNRPGSYGTEGTASASNIPGARDYAAFATDATGNLWFSGGDGLDSTGSSGGLNDLWKYSAGQWTWVSGSDLADQPAVYGTQGIAASGNVPGARQEAVAWIDASGNFWLFGGEPWNGNASTGLNDLWKYGSGEWTWVAGSDLTNQPGTYGTLGVASASNTPGSRYGSVRWTDSSGNFWLFGGYGYDSAGTPGSLNDLWKFSTSTGEWTWENGSNIADQTGTFGTKGVAAPGNVPGARYGAVGWVDSSGNFWLTAGTVSQAKGSGTLVYDLWKYSVSSGQWTLVNSASASSPYGSYGTQGTAAAANYPGQRQWPSAWVDTTGNFWVFGGAGYGSSGSGDFDLDDLWIYQP